MITVGIDLGGTNIAAGAVSKEGKILGRATRPTGATRPYTDVIRDMYMTAVEAVVNAGLSMDDVTAIGVGVPGFFDKENGIIVFCTNLGWHDVPFAEEMAKYTPVPVTGDNDATVAGFAEAMTGVSRKVKSSVFLTLGTGVGGGIIINRKILSGAHGVGSELGHIMFQKDGLLCTCGQRGCFERYASATALARIGCEHAALYVHSELAKVAPCDMTAKIVIDLARRNDPAATEAFEEYTTNLALGIVTIISFCDPELIVLGGGVAAAGDFLLKPIRRKVYENKFFKTLPCGEVVLAQLGNDAGIIGAALLHKG